MKKKQAINGQLNSIRFTRNDREYGKWYDVRIKLELPVTEQCCGDSLWCSLSVSNQGCVSIHDFNIQWSTYPEKLREILKRAEQGATMINSCNNYASIEIDKSPIRKLLALFSWEDYSRCKDDFLRYENDWKENCLNEMRKRIAENEPIALAA